MRTLAAFDLWRSCPYHRVRLQPNTSFRSRTQTTWALSLIVRISFVTKKIPFLAKLATLRMQLQPVLLCPLLSALDPGSGR